MLGTMDMCSFNFSAAVGRNEFDGFAGGDD